MAEYKIEDTIAIETLWAIFTLVKRAVYSSSIEVRNGFVADPEMIYECLRKELCAQSQLGMS